jgi:hypothetical protein
MIEQRQITMQTKPRSHNLTEKLTIWAGRAMIALALLCGSYFIVDIVRMLRMVYASWNSAASSGSKETAQLRRRQLIDSVTRLQIHSWPTIIMIAFAHNSYRRAFSDHRFRCLELFSCPFVRRKSWSPTSGVMMTE